MRLSEPLPKQTTGRVRFLPRTLASGMRRFRFRLPVLILVVSAFAVFFVTLRPTIHRYSVERRWQSVGADLWYYRSGKATGLVLQGGHQMRDEDWKSMDDVFFLGFRGRVTSDDWRHLESMPRLNTLDLIGAAIGDADLPRLRGLPRLSHLYLDRTRITDAGLAHLVGLNIEHLELEGTAISDAGLPYLGQMQNLQTLHLTGSKVSDTGLQALRKQLPSCEIW